MLITAGSVAYITVLPSTNTPSPNSNPNDALIGNVHSNQTEVKKSTANFTEPKREPANLVEVKKPIADVPASNKPPLNMEASKPPAADVAGPKEKTSPYLSRIKESIIAENTKDPILYIYVLSQLTGKGIREMPVRATPTNSTNRTCGAGGEVPSGAVILDPNRVKLPNGNIITYPTCPGPTTFTTNSTGYAAIPLANAKFYWITFGLGMRDPANPLWEEQVPVQANQSKVVTASVDYDPYMLDFTAALFREGNSTKWIITNESAGVSPKFVYGPDGCCIHNSGPEISNITVKLGQTVRLRILNFDPVAPHGFVFPDFKILHLQGGMPLGSGHQVIFNANKVGEFKFYCTLPDEVVNGVLVKHSEEVGWLIVDP